LSVSGKVAPEIENPAPETAAELIVTAAVPVDESVIDCEAVEFTARLPKLRVVALTVKFDVAAFNCKAKV
jgi:hypothetical protein